MKPTFKNINQQITSPWIIAFVPLIITILLTFNHFQKYKLKLIAKDEVLDDVYVSNDLNNDGTSEYIMFRNYSGGAQVEIYDYSEQFEEVYNLPGKWFFREDTSPVFYINDINDDENNEIITFTVNQEDSVFISVINHYPQKSIILKKFLMTIGKYKGNYDHRIVPIGLIDNNGDKFKEFLFSVNGGYLVQPRAIFAWDYKNDTIYRSPEMGSSIASLEGDFYFGEIDGDSIKEIFIKTVATENYRTYGGDELYQDTSSWIMAFTKNLNFLFPPVQIEGPQSKLYHFPHGTSETGVFISQNRDGYESATFQIYNLIGKKTKEKIVENIEDGIKLCYYENEQIYLFNKRKGFLDIYLLNKDSLALDKKKSIPNINKNPVFFDVDGNQEKEIVLYSQLESKIYVVSENLENINDVQTTFLPDYSSMNISRAIENGETTHFDFVVNGVEHVLSYKKNPVYYLSFLFALFYYVFLVWLFSMLKKSWLLSLVRKQQTEKEMQNLQMKTVMNQLNPHFTYNAINTVGAAILNHEPKKAYNALTTVSQLFRKSVDHAFQPYKTLIEEIEFVKDYLEVEKLRFGEGLTYNIEIEPGIDLNIKIPKMLIQLFVENAIKHGIFHKKNRNGNVEITIKKMQNKIKITVEDDGIGRQKAKELNFGRKGKGLIILKEYLKLFEIQYGSKISFLHLDIKKNNNISGTSVEIFIS